MILIVVLVGALLWMFMRNHKGEVCPLFGGNKETFMLAVHGDTVICIEGDAGGQGGYVAPAFLSNGFHGLRLGPIPFLADPYAGTSRPSGPYPGGTPTVPAVLAGYLHRDPKGRQRVLAAAPFPFETAIRVGGTLLSNRTAHLVTVLAQSFDHRAIDGAYSAAFLHRVREIIQTTNWATIVS